MYTYQVLGIHGEDVPTVEGNVARVRVFQDGEAYDFDIELPKVLTFEELLIQGIEKKLSELPKNEKNNIIFDENFDKAEGVKNG